MFVRDLNDRLAGRAAVAGERGSRLGKRSHGADYGVEPSGPEAFALYGGHLVVECSTPGGPLELAMSRSALTGFSSWLEAGPPGADWDSGRVR